MIQENNKENSGLSLVNPYDAENDELTTSSEQPLYTSISFGVFGFVLQIFFSTGIAASQDILEETLVPTPVLLISASLPFFIITSILPHFVQRLSHKLLLVPIVSLSIGGLLLYALVEGVVLRVVGVVVVSSGVATGEVTFVSHTALFKDSAMSAYSAGTGLGFIIGPLYYAAMTTVLCVPPQTTILIIAGVPLVLPLFYNILEQRNHRPANHAITHRDIPYTALDENNVDSIQDQLTCKEKLTLILDNIYVALACFVGYFSEYLSLNGVITTLAFPNSPFDPRSHFVYYACVFMIGECIGRSYLSFLTLVDAKCVFVVKQTWVLSAILFGLLVFLTLASWSRFLPSVWIVLFLVFNLGLFAGSLYLNTFLVASEKQDEKGKAFSRAFLSVGPSAGVLVAGLVGLVLEPVLREHCLSMANMSDSCFTRSMGGWNETTSCLRL